MLHFLRKRLLALLSFILVLVMTSAPAQSESGLEAGLALYKTERFSEAVTQFKRSIATQPNPIDEALTQRYLALAYQELGQWSQAKTAIDRSLQLLKTQRSQDSTYFEVLAKVLNTQGRHQFQTGQLEAALAAWQQATLNYQKAGSTEGIISGLTNQAIALQSLGFSVKAQALLSTVYQTLQTMPSLKAEGLSHLGEAFRRLGALNQSHRILQEALTTAQQQNSPSSTILLELGNTERLRAQQNLAIGKTETAQTQTQQALAYYELASPDGSNLQAQANAFSLLVETHQYPLANQRWQAIEPLLQNSNPSRATLYTQLNLAQNLIQLKKESPDSPTVDAIAQLIAAAYNQAKTLQDPRTESYALGQLGELYEFNQQLSLAQQATLQALQRIEGLQTPDLSYRWEWQLGRLLNQQNQRASAIQAYTRSITALKSLRENLLLVNAEVQFSFRDRVEPIYRDLTDLLLQRNPDGSEPPQTQLQSAIANIDSLQLAELENFLRCDLSQLASLSQDLDRIDRQAAFIYPIILKNRIEVIVRLPGQSLKHYTTEIAQTSVETTIQTLRKAIVRSNASEVITQAQTLYDWLIKPLESDLNPSIETLVFVLDGSLRNIPMTVLYDRKTQQYLLEKPYDIALLPSSQLFDLRSLPQSGKVLGAGISEPLKVGNLRFNALNAQAELAQIQPAKTRELLLNTDFTQANLQAKLQSQSFSTVHLVTHGQFSSDPEETYLLVHSDRPPQMGKLLKPNDFTDLLRSPRLPSLQNTPRNLDLLILSACETAEGDNRATLGLVGVAVRAGARSTLGTLWQVSDASTIALMNQFYRELNQPGISKAKALHRAQRSLLSKPNYQNPYYWSPYIIVGNWR
jgi:CHAT domain-containing protein